MIFEAPVKTRFCPSPTGLMHLGNARTALFNELFARSQDGHFLLRIEDTDQERSKLTYAEGLQADLRWLGLIWDEGPGADGGHGPYWQSKRQAVYADYYERLQEAEVAYPCFCSEEQLALTRKVQRAAGRPPRYPGTCRDLTAKEIAQKLEAGEKPTLRFRVPDDETITFHDLVRGVQQFASQDIGDFIIRRANGTSPFMFCNAIDDALMGVTHVLRGEDHLTNTPRQIMILQALGLSIPTYGHIALIVGHDGSPLSKRHGSRSIDELSAQGYLATAMNNYLARLGHYYANEAFLSLEELAQAFKVENLSKSPAKFDWQQLNYWQKEAVMRLTSDEFWRWLGTDLTAQVPVDKQALFMEAVRPNMLFPHDADYWIEVCFAHLPAFKADEQAILQKAGKAYFIAAEKYYIEQHAELKSMMKSLQQDLGIKGKALYKPLRIALTGVGDGPELGKLLSLINHDTIVHRLQYAAASCL